MLLAKMTSDKDNAFSTIFSYIPWRSGLSPLITIIAKYGFPQYENDQTKFLFMPWEFAEIYILGILLIITVTGTIGIFLLVYAYNIGSPQSNAPMEYVLLFYSLVWAFLFLEKFPIFYLF